MRYSTLGIGFIFVITLLVSVLWAGTETSKTPPEVPDGWIVIEEIYLIPLEDEPEHHFHQARENLFRKNMKAAVAEIKKGAAFLRLEAGHTATKGKTALMASVHELEKLAETVEKGAVASARDIDQTFARAHQALATHYQSMTTKSWTKKTVKKAGHYLKAAANHVEQAMIWSGYKLESGAKTIIKDARMLGGKMVRGTGWAADEVGKGIESIGKEIQTFGKKIEPGK